MKVKPNHNLFITQYNNYDAYFKWISEKYLSDCNSQFDYIMSLCWDDIEFSYVALKNKYLTPQYNEALFKKSLRNCLKNHHYIYQLLMKGIIKKEYDKHFFYKCIYLCLFSPMALSYAIEFLKYNIVNMEDEYNEFEEYLDRVGCFQLIGTIFHKHQNYIYYLWNSIDKDNYKENKPYLYNYLADFCTDKTLLNNCNIKRDKINKNDHFDIWSSLLTHLFIYPGSAFQFMTSNEVTYQDGEIYQLAVDSCYTNLDLCFSSITMRNIKKEEDPINFYRFIIKTLKYDTVERFKLLIYVDKIQYKDPKQKEMVHRFKDYLIWEHSHIVNNNEDDEDEN